jgi:hypothetical protein
MKKYLILLTALIASTGFAQVSVRLASPAANSNLAAPFQMSASASSSHPIVGWHAYLDSVMVFTGGATGSVSGSLSAATGTHQLVIRAWDSTGAYGDQTVTVKVGSTSGGSTGGSTQTSALPTPPSTAKVFSNINANSSGWSNCGDPGCAGGNGGGNYWQAFYQTNPSMSGSSMELYRDGVWANALWFRKQGAVNGATNFLSDFYLMLDQASLTSGQALEYDGFQFVGGYNYMMGTQCDYGRGMFDTWSEVSGHWVPTNIPCPKFTPNVWHHIQWYVTTNHSDHSYTYVTLVVDGKAYGLNQKQYAKYLAWGDNLGNQWQLGVNATGQGFHEWIDKATLTVW